MNRRARNLHHLTGAALLLRLDATGECHLCRRRSLEHPVTRWLIDSANERFPLCEAHARPGQELGYEVVGPAPADSPP